MTEIIGHTESLCPECLKRLPATRVVENGDVYLDKTCPEHGRFKVLIWRGADFYSRWGKQERTFLSNQGNLPPGKGCPYDCGLCSDHRMDSCTFVLEVTNRCNLKCAFCFASANENELAEPSIQELRGALQDAISSAGNPFPLEISGGEPTVRDDLPEIVAKAKELGFSYIQLNTNGIRLANDLPLLKKLKEAGLNTLYLQFDGVDNNIYQKLRGKDLLEVKNAVLAKAKFAGLAVVLVPTLVAGVNDGQIGKIITFAKSWMPVVKGVHFQPVTYLGRHFKEPTNRNRLGIPEVLESLDEQTGGELKWDHFVPSKCQNPYCSFSGYFILEDGRLKPVHSFHRSEGKKVDCNPAPKSRDYIERNWGKASAADCGCRDGCCNSKDSLVNFYEYTLLQGLSISCMPFQDAWTIDLERLRDCCIHVISKNRLIPFCAYYATGTDGRRLYR